jgi:hypothetical protein
MTENLSAGFKTMTEEVMHIVNKKVKKEGNKNEDTDDNTK